MKVLVLGATGNIGRLVVDLLLRQGHQVIAFVHHSHTFTESGNLSVLSGDVHQAADLERAIIGADAVISTLGSWHTKQKDILSAATQTLVPLLERSGPRRIITLTGSDARSSADIPTGLQKLLRPVFRMIAPKILEDAELHMQLLQNSTLDWTIVRSPVMRSWGSSGNGRLDMIAPLPWETVHRQDVARLLVTQLETKEYLYKAPHLHGS